MTTRTQAKQIAYATKVVDRPEEFSFESNDCSVRSISNVSGIPYETVHETLRILGREQNKGTSLFHIKSALTALGIKYEDVSRKYRSERSHGSLKLVTLLNQVPKHKRFLVIYSGHIFAIVNGKIKDDAKYQCNMVCFVVIEIVRD